MANTLSIDELPLACSYWLKMQIEAVVIPGVNFKIQGAYDYEANPALFVTSVLMGELTNTDNATICIWAEKGSQPVQAEMNGFTPQTRISLCYKIRIVLPEAGGGNTVGDFELSKQCAIGGMTAFLWDTTQTMQPAVYTKADPDNVVKAVPPCRAGEWRSVFTKPLDDKLSVPRSVETSFTFNFWISGGLVLSHP